MVQNKVNLDIRVPVKSLKALQNLFIGNPNRHTTYEMAQAADVSTKYVRDLKLIHTRRPDLADKIFNDELSLFKAMELMRADPSLWKTQVRTRL